MDAIANIFWFMVCVAASLIPLSMLYVLVKGTWIVLHAVWAHPWLS